MLKSSSLESQVKNSEVANIPAKKSKSDTKGPTSSKMRSYKANAQGMRSDSKMSGSQRVSHLKGRKSAI